MRALFYVADEQWTGAARAFVTAARGLAARGHHVSVACGEGTVAARRTADAGLELVSAGAGTNIAADAWWLRRTLRDRFIEVVFVHGEREQLAVSSAMRLAERGAVIRRVPAFCAFELQRSGRLALRLASTGALFTTEHDVAMSDVSRLVLPPAVAPLGVDPSVQDGVRAVPRHELGVRDDALLVVCDADRDSRLRVATALRTLALLAPRHPELRLVVVGTGADDGDARMHAAALGIGSRVVFRPSNGDHLGVLKAADVVWVASALDDAAWTILDAMAFRVPVVADRSPLASHYVADGITGVLLPPGEPAHTASFVAAFLADPERRAAMGNAGRLRAQREFPESAMIDGFERAVAEAGDRSRWAVR